jgi:hypothetical protein
MGFTGIESVVDAIVTTLQAGMAAKVTALNAAYADGHTLTVPATASYYTELVDPLAPNFTVPAIMVAAYRGEPTAQNGRTIEMTWPCAVIALVRGSDAHDTSRQLYRYARAIKEILLDPSGSGPYCTLMTEDWSSPLTTNRASGDTLQDVPIWLRFVTAESLA